MGRFFSITGLRDAVLYVWLISRESYRSFKLNNNFHTAATLAYYGFFSLIPLLLLVVILLGHLTLSSEVVLAGIESLTARILPEYDRVVLQELYALSEQKIWGVFSVVVLIWVIAPFANAIRSALARTFKSTRTMGFLKKKLLNLAGVLALLVLFVFLVVGRIFYSRLIVTWLPDAATLRRVLDLAVPVVASVLFLGFFYVVFTPVRLRLRDLLAGAGLTTALLFIIRPAFMLVLKINPNYGFAFGSLKAIFLLTVWVYYAFLVVLLGAEVMANARKREALLMRRLFDPAPRRSPRLSPLLERFVVSPEDGDVLFREGDPGRDMFFVLQGSVSVRKDDRVVRTLGEGSFFGEMSLLLDEPRTATVQIEEPGTRLVRISHGNFDTILNENPEVMKTMLKELSSRLKTTTGQM